MECWGYSTHMDFFICNPMIIRSPLYITDYVITLCKMINMKRYGDMILKHFGNNDKVKGYTFMQLIETSSISGHLVERTNDAFIDIFSCKEYDGHAVHEFTKEFFQAKKSKFSILER